MIASLILWLALAGLAVKPAAAEVTSQEPKDVSYQMLQQRDDRLLVRLDNRLLVVAQELPTAPVVSVQSWIKTGSVYEQEFVGAGLSHFLEHLVSGGTTTRRSEAESSALLGKIGARTNAATSLDTVRYYINTSSDYTDVAIDLISDWMQNSTIPQAEFERERQVIQREFEHGMGDPGRTLWRLIQQARFQAHPARHPTIGYLDEFLDVTREQIVAFYQRMYVPNNMVLVVVGDIDKQQVVDQIARLWGDVPAGPLPKLTFPIEPAMDGPRRRDGVAAIQRPRLQLVWPGTRLGQEGDYALDLLATILGQGESSRLTREVRDRQGVVYTTSAYNLSFDWGEGFFAIQSEVSDAGLEELVDPDERLRLAVARAETAILKQVEDIREHGVTPEELARAKRQTLAAVVMSGQTAEGLASRLARDLIAMGDPDYLDHYAQAVQAVTASDVQAAAEAYLIPQRQITVTLLPQSEQRPLEPMVRQRDDDQADLPVEQVSLDNAAIADRLWQVEQARQHQQDRPAVELDDVRQYELSNGLRLLVQRSTLTPTVSMQLYQLGGLLAEQPGRQGVAGAMMNMLMRGTTTRTAQQIARTVEDLGARLDTQVGNNTMFVQAASLKEDWPAVMELMADVVLNPAFPQDEWERMRPRLLAAIARQNDSWAGELRQHFIRTWFGQNHAWSTSSLGHAQVVAGLEVEDLQQFHQQRFGASQAVLAVFGDVDPDQVAQQAEAFFASLPARPAAPLDLPGPVEPNTGVHAFVTSKPMAAVQIGFGPGVTRQSDDYPALAVLGRVLSDFPSGWLEQALRGEGPGLVYAVGAYNVTGVVPGYFTLLFNTQPQAVPEAVSRTMALIDRLRDEPVDEATLQRAKAAVLTSEFLGKQSNSDRAMEAALNTLYGLPADESERFRAAVHSLSARDLQAAARQYLTHPTTVVISHQPIEWE